MADNVPSLPPLHQGGENGFDGADFDGSDAESFFDSDVDDFDAISVEEPQEEVLGDDFARRPTSPDAFGAENLAIDSDDSSVDSVLQSPSNQNPTNPTSSTPDAADKPIPKGKSIAHHIIKDGTAVFCSFDLESGGEFCGIIQLSAEIFRQNPVDLMGTDFIRESECFNEYVKPPDGALWDERASRNSHGLTASSDCIKTAHRFDVVWGQFCSWISRHIRPNETVIFVAYNGATCDLRWIWKHLQAPRTTLSMPQCIKFFLDPLKVIQAYKSCPMHPSKSKLESLELGCVYKFITGSNLNGAHDSLVDARAQTDVVVCKSFVNFIDKTQSIRLIEDIFSKTERSKMSKLLEPTRPVHEPWLELEAGSVWEWTAPARDTYNGAGGGAVHGPSNAMIDAARTGNLLNMFLLIIPESLLTYIAERTQAYAHEDWVVPIPRIDREGNAMSRPILTQIFPEKPEDIPPNARHRFQPGPGWKKYSVTPWFVLAWIGILIIAGGLFKGDNNCGINNIYRKPPYGVSVPYIQNAMTATAFLFMRNYIHFSDSSKRVPKGQHGYDPLFKCRYVMNQIMLGLSKAWTAGDRVTIDESMIRYMGRAVAFIQYMPRKPIKHGLKVFAICCAYSAVLLGFEVYCGADDDVDNSSTAIVMRLIAAAGLTDGIGRGIGRTLYTDNWYSTIKLAMTLKEKLGWWFCGTYTLSKKVSRQDEDVPFHLLSNGALASVERGWFRQAVLWCKTRTGKRYPVQVDTWKDKKQVAIVTTHPDSLGPSSGLFVTRSSRGQREQSILPAPRSILDYSEFFNAVDRNDRDSSDYTTSLLTNRWYLRIVFWLLDRVVHLLFKSTEYCVELYEWWELYIKKDGCFIFQIDLGMIVLNYAISKAWPDLNGPRPDWMRQGALLPCECGKCFFCINGLTGGIAHRHQRPVRTYIHHYDNTRTVTNGCTEVRVNLDRGNQYCRMCYRNMPDYNEDGVKMTAAMKKKACRYSRLGCASCDEQICDACWEAGYDRHELRGPN